MANFEGATVMREHVIQVLKKFSCVPGKQKTWISELTNDQLYELFLRLRNGDDAKSISRYIQKAWGILPQSTPHAVSQGVNKFRRRIAHLLLPTSDLSLTTHPGTENISDNLESISKIMKMQLQRINRMIAEEREIGIKHNSLSREIHALTALMKSITKAKEWEMLNEGSDPLHRRRWEAKKRKIESQFSSFLKSSDDHSNFLNAADRFLDLCEQHAITIDMGPNGQYTLAKHSDDT
jgi:hypothetical protein